ncbi:MAG: hypothetical protein QM767_14250 [Anaeromyxobacter sp.]
MSLWIQLTSALLPGRASAASPDAAARDRETDGRRRAWQQALEGAIQRDWFGRPLGAGRDEDRREAPQRVAAAAGVMPAAAVVSPRPPEALLAEAGSPAQPGHAAGAAGGAVSRAAPARARELELRMASGSGQESRPERTGCEVERVACQERPAFAPGAQASAEGQRKLEGAALSGEPLALPTGTGGALDQGAAAPARWPVQPWPAQQVGAPASSPPSSAAPARPVLAAIVPPVLPRAMPTLPVDTAVEAAAGATGPAQPQQGGEKAEPIRWHAEWTEEGVRVWVGADRDAGAPLEQLTAQLLTALQRWAQAQGTRLLSLVCNGREVHADLRAREQPRPARQGERRAAPPEIPSIRFIPFQEEVL